MAQKKAEDALKDAAQTAKDMGAEAGAKMKSAGVTAKDMGAEAGAKMKSAGVTMTAKFSVGAGWMKSKTGWQLSPS